MRGTQLGAVEQILEYGARLLHLADAFEQQSVAQPRLCAGISGRNRRVFALGLGERVLCLERTRVQHPRIRRFEIRIVLHQAFERGRFARAIEVYQGGLQGIFEHDPTLLLGLARAQFASQDFAAARASLERLMQHNSEFKSADAGLLYARALEAQDALAEAEREYAAVAPGFPGAEARLRYALLLKRRGKLPEARAVLKDLLDGAKLRPAHYRRAQAEWLDRARRELS